MKYVYLFKEGDASMRNTLGGKGANLAEMTKIGLPVPQGFTISTEACTKYYEDGRRINDDIQAEIMENIAKMEKSPARSSAIWRIRSWFPFAPAPVRPCRA